MMYCFRTTIICLLIAFLLMIFADRSWCRAESLPPNNEDQQATAGTNSPPADMSHCPSWSRQASNQENALKTDDFDCEELNFCDDRIGFEAILNLHRQLDEDANGDIDITETNEFIRDELKYENGADRHRAFHGNDKHITVDEMWRAWRLSTVHNWTVDETVDWLVDVVELPKYKEVFITNSVNGVALPRLASNSPIFNSLGINNPIHKQKIALKAMDVVLFGMPKPKSTHKDVLLGFLGLFAIVVAWFAYRQHNDSKKHLKKMMKDIEALANAEKQLEQLQEELDRTKQENENAFKAKMDLEKKLKEKSETEQFLNGPETLSNNSIGGESASLKMLEDELKRTKSELSRIEQAYQSRQWVPPRALQQYLQLTYEIETRYYNAKKAAAEQQLQAAREGCDKLKRKRSSIFGAFRVAHSSSMDYVDHTIVHARTLLTELTHEMQERIKRWKQIETYCAFEIIHNPGAQFLEQQLYGSVTLTTMRTSASSNSLSKMMMRRGSEATLADNDDSLSLFSATSGFANATQWSPWSTLGVTSAVNYGKRISSASAYPSTVSEEADSTIDEEGVLTLETNRRKTLPANNGSCKQFDEEPIVVPSESQSSVYCSPMAASSSTELRQRRPSKHIRLQQQKLQESEETSSNDSTLTLNTCGITDHHNETTNDNNNQSNIDLSEKQVKSISYDSSGGSSNGGNSSGDSKKSSPNGKGRKRGGFFSKIKMNLR